MSCFHLVYNLTPAESFLLYCSTTQNPTVPICVVYLLMDVVVEFVVPTAAVSQTLFEAPQVSVAEQNSAQWAARYRPTAFLNQIFHRCPLIG